MIQPAIRAFLNLDILLRYMLGGGLGAITQFSTLLLLHDMLGLNATLSSAVGFAFAVTVNYSFQYYMTFKATGAHGFHFKRFASVALIGLSINTSVFYVIHTSFHLHHMLAQVGAIAVVFSFNYLMNYFYTFAHHVKANQ